MALRTKAEYVESLRDGREVYMFGERVEDVTKHPVLKKGMDHIGIEFELAFKPEFKDLATVPSPDTGNLMYRLYKFCRNTDDLLKRSQLIRLATAQNDGVSTASKAIGTDGLNALYIAGWETDQALGTNYSERIQKFRSFCQENDLSLAGAVTDVKGDRRLRPGQQGHPDYYVHVVDKNKDGIVVRGAKMHCSYASYVNWLIAVPCRFMTEEDKDYAVAFAVPVNAKGLKLFNSPIGVRDPNDYPISSQHPIVESMVVFDDVFIPWERVFMCGEWQQSALAANWFGMWHRFTGLSYKQADAQMIVGAACLAAEYNGVSDAPHIREELLEIMTYASAIEVFAKAAANDCVILPSGIACPNPMITNLGKYLFATGFGKAMEHLLEICGGAVVTTPGGKDYANPMIKPYMDKFLGGKKGIPAENRIKLLKFVKDFAASDFGGHWLVTTLHAEGSIAAQKITMLRQFDVEPCIERVKKTAGIKD